MSSQPIRNTKEEQEQYLICLEGTHIENEFGTCETCGAVNGYYYLEDQDEDLIFSKGSYEFVLGTPISSEQWDRIKKNWYDTITGTILEMKSDPNFADNKV